jgi:hypothetical protein
MATITLADILINARQESIRMRHYYLGVEHLFISLLEIHGGLTATLLEEQGLTPRYIVDSIRRIAGKGNRQRLWAGIPNTPRADIVLGIANDLALEDRRTEISERDLLIAILDENDSIPVRVLRRLRINIDLLLEAARSTPSQHVHTVTTSYVRVEFGPAFDAHHAIPEEYLFIMRRMFMSYYRIRIERALGGSYSGASLYVVTPFHADGAHDSAVVVKLDRADNILEEAARYEAHVRHSLPPLTARLEDKPVTVETSDFAALKYTFVSDIDGSSRDLREAAPLMPDLGGWLEHSLYPYFGKTWWMQRYPYRFQVWMEYDWLLPPLFILDYISEADTPADAAVLTDPIRRASISRIDYGDPVIIDNFTVHRVFRDQNAIQLSVGKGTEATRRAWKIVLRGINLSEHAFFRGEVIERIAGRVYETRSALLMQQLAALSPDFDPTADVVPGFDAGGVLPNPLLRLDATLEDYYNGSLSKIHGDLHLGNILINASQHPFLIDFAHTRSGHTLFDWALLELSLLTDLIMPGLGDDWATARAIAHDLALLNDGEYPPGGQFAALLTPIVSVRRVVSACLAKPDTWGEYHIALAMTALRGFAWDTITLGARRLLFTIAAMSFAELKRRRAGDGDSRTSGGFSSD